MNDENSKTPASTEPMPVDSPPSQDSKNLALLCWIGSALLGFIPGLAFYLVKKDDAYVQDQAKEALNWGITFLLVLIVGKILTIILVGFLVIGFAWMRGSPVAGAPTSSSSGSIWASILLESILYDCAMYCSASWVRSLLLMANHSVYRLRFA